MEDNTLVKSSFSATIHAPIEDVDIPTWCFGLSESEYQACSPAHVGGHRLVLEGTVWHFLSSPDFINLRVELCLLLNSRAFAQYHM